MTTASSAGAESMLSRAELTELEAQVCIVGSGAGGSAAAARMAEQGLSVIVLEAGPALKTEDFNANPTDMSRRMYAEMGLSAALGLPPIPIYYGQCLGGSTTINSGTCFQTPVPVLHGWSRSFGFDPKLPERLATYYRQVASDIHIATPSLEDIGRNGEILHEGRLALGASGGVIARNAKGCKQSGVCCFGCPSGAKQSTLVSYLPKALAAGARVFVDSPVEAVEFQGSKLRGVRCRLKDGRLVRVAASTVVIACGAMMSPALLARSGVRSKHLGRHLTLHPAVKIAALMKDEFHSWEGIPQSYYVDEWHSQGFLIETIAVPPTVEAMGLPGHGRFHQQLMAQSKRLATWGAMISDHGEGRLISKAGQIVPIYQLKRRDAAVALEALRRCAQLAFAAGAERVYTSCYGAKEFRSMADVERYCGRPVDASRLDLAAFHPLGSCRMGASASASVVDLQHRVHGHEGLYVVDGSVFPSSLSVNPQWTIMAFALRAADHIVEQLS